MTNSIQRLIRWCNIMGVKNQWTGKELMVDPQNIDVEPGYVETLFKNQVGGDFDVKVTRSWYFVTDKSNEETCLV